MAQIAAVAVDKATPQFDREYSYLVPDGLPVQVGCRVTVPFGRGNRRRLGLVLSLSESEDTARLKKIASLGGPSAAHRGGTARPDALAAGTHLLQLV